MSRGPTPGDHGPPPAPFLKPLSSTAPSRPLTSPGYQVPALPPDCPACPCSLPGLPHPPASVAQTLSSGLQLCPNFPGWFLALRLDISEPINHQDAPWVPGLWCWWWSSVPRAGHEAGMLCPVQVTMLSHTASILPHSHGSSVLKPLNVL